MKLIRWVLSRFRRDPFVVSVCCTTQRGLIVRRTDGHVLRTCKNQETAQADVVSLNKQWRSLSNQ